MKMVEGGIDLIVEFNQKIVQTNLRESDEVRNTHNEKLQKY